MRQAEETAEDEAMCLCSGTTRAEIRQLFTQGMNLEAISRHTGALTGCGGCEWDIAQFLETLEGLKNPK